jgi:hypothetical protein
MTVEGTEIREEVEWVSFRWHNEPDRVKPRVLLVGDSIVAAHGARVHERLKADFCVDYFATSKHVTDVAFMGDLDFMMARRPYALVLFNNGLHGLGIDDELYAPALKKALLALRGRTPRLAWRISTPILAGPGASELGADNAHVVRRNADAAVVAADLGLPVLDLYTPMLEHRDWIVDGVHCNADGQALQADIVAKFLTSQFQQESGNVAST